MSQENVDIVRRLFALWEGDAEIAYLRDDAAWARYKPGIEALFEPDCTFAWIGGGIESEYSGLDGFREDWLDIYEAWESARNVELMLPETGVCSVNRGAEDAAATSACCGTNSLLEIESSATA